MTESTIKKGRIMETGLYQRVCKIYDEISFDHEYWDLINGQLRRQLLECYTDDLTLLMRNNKMSFISVDNWRLIADVLDKKIKRKRGVKPRNNYYRNEIITLKVMELYAIEPDILNAFINTANALMISMPGEAIDKDRVKQIYYECKDSFGKDYTIDDIKRWGLETQEQWNTYNREGKQKIKLW
jgi:hypothetical protein